MKFKLIVLFVLLLAFRVQAIDGPEITLKNEVSISKDKIYLGDVAEITGPDTAQVEQLKTVYLKRAASPGFKISVTKENILNRIKKYYPDIDIIGPDSISVTTRKSTITRDELTATVEKYVKENMPWKSEDTAIEIRPSKDEVRAAEGEVLLKVKEDYSSLFKGNIVVPVEVYIDGKFFKIEPVSLVVRVTSDCFMAERIIKKGEQVTEADVRKIRKEITNLPADIVTEIGSFRGKVTRRAIIRGSLIIGSMLEKTPFFRRGSSVKVIVTLKNMTIETTGTAEGSGVEGETVKVKLLSGKILEGIVNETGQVIIQK